MYVRIWSVAVWALVGASSLFWCLKLVAQPLPLPPQTTVAMVPTLLQTDLARLAGADGEASPAGAATPAAASPSDGRLVLLGVVSAPLVSDGLGAAQTGAANPGSLDGLALISVDGKAPRAFAVGAVVDGDWVLQSVSPRKALVGKAGQPAQVTLTLPEPSVGAPGGATPQGATAPGSYVAPTGAQVPEVAPTAPAAQVAPDAAVSAEPGQLPESGSAPARP